MAKDFSDSGVTAAESKLLATYFREAAARLKKTIKSPPGGTSGGQAFRRGRAALQLAQVDDVLRGLKAKTSNWVAAKIPAVYREGLEAGARQAEESGVRVADSGLSGSFSQVDEQAVLALARDTLLDTSKAADSMGNTARRVIRQTAELDLSNEQINRILAGGIIEGKPAETIRELKEALEKVYGEEMTITTKSGGTMTFNVADYAEIVARTRTREAVEIARHNKLEDLGIDLVSIVGRISNTFCTAFLGKVFSLSGTSAKYPPLSSLPGARNGRGGPPFHPRCSKSTRPFIEDLATDAQLAAAVMNVDQRSLLGMDTSKAQRSYKDLQIRAQVEDKYRASTKPGMPVGAQKPVVPAGESAKTAALRKKLEAVRASSAKKADQIAKAEAELAEQRLRLSALLASGAAGREEIEAIRKAIARAEATTAAYERAVRRKERRE